MIKKQVLKDENHRLRRALQDLTDALDKVPLDKRFVQVWQFGEQKFGKYAGPTWHHQLAAAKEALKKSVPVE